MDKLSYNFLLGTEFFCLYQLHIIWGEPDTSDMLQIGDSGRQIYISAINHCQKLTASLQTTHTIIIPPSHNIQLNVTHRTLPITTYGYLIEPVTFQDPYHLSYISAIHSIVDNYIISISIANFGQVPVKIHHSQHVGHLYLLVIAPSVEAFFTEKNYIATELETTGLV